jgi:predicted phage terminase large subunit-like protein
MPPRHCKSMLASQYFPSWYLGKNPKNQIIAASYGDDLARDFGRKVRNTIAEGEYQQIFSTKLSADSSSQNKFNTNEGGVYVATGIGGSITGRGADLALIDDPVKGRQDADSEQMRKKVWEWYTSVLRTRLMPNAAIVVIGTRWHKDDLIGRLIKDNTEKWEVLHFPAINEDNEPLWPEQFTLEELEKTRLSIGPREWQCLYQGNPVDPENQIFHEEYFRYYDQLPELGPIYMVVDPAFTKSKHSDYSAIVCATKVNDKYYILDYSHKKLTPDELVNEIFRMWKKWKPDDVGIESFAAQNTIGYWLLEKASLEGLPFTYREIRQSGDKEAKIKRLEPYLRNGKVYMKSHMTELQAEFLQFPQGDHDDLIDAVQMLLEFNSTGKMEARTDEGYFQNLGIKYNQFGEPQY